MNTGKLQPVLIILGLIGVLTFLFIKTQENDAIKHHRVILAIQKLAHQDALLNESILEFKADRFSNYDQITKINLKIDRQIAWIKSADTDLYGKLGNDFDNAINDADRQFKSKMELVERFKSHNGLLKNSLYYLPTAIENSQNDLRNGLFHSDLNVLLREMLLFNSRPNEQNKTKAFSYIEKLHNSQQASLIEIALHATTVINQREKLQAIVDILFEIPTMSRIEKVYQIYSEHNARKMESVSKYETAMYVMALLMILYVLCLFFTLRRTMQHLEGSLYEVAFQKEALDEHAIVVTINPDGIISYVNNKFVEISQFSKSELVGQSWKTLFFDNHSEDYFTDIWSSLEVGNRWKGEIQNKKKGGSYYWVDATIVPFVDKLDKPIRYVALSTDITERKLSEDHNYNLAHYDNLTKLPNRAFYLKSLEDAISHAAKIDSKLAVLFLDLDNFKIINDTMGHASGDELLKIVAEHLKLCVRDVDSVSRLGGDEFTITLTSMQSLTNIETVVERIMSISKQSITLGHKDIVISTSVGISIYPDDAKNVDSLLKNADLAMYQAKAAGKNNYMFFSKQFELEKLERQSIENELRHAIEHHQFELYYQPQVSSSSNEICAVEALIRWNHPKKGLVPPDEFIPILEESGLIIEVGKWVLTEACKQLVIWKKLDFNLRIAVNVSAHQLRDEHLITLLKQLLKNHSIQPEELELELTESCILQNPEFSISILTALNDLGINLSLDDFGTGHSSLSYLKKLPINTLKIDRSFVKDLPDDQHDLAIATTILAMAKNLGLNVVAEGVETAEQLYFLRENGCDYLQGYYFSKPVPAEELQCLLYENQATCNKHVDVRIAQ